MISLQNLKDVLQGVTDKIMTKVNGKQEEIPTYTLAEYEAIKDDIPEGSLFNISDDETKVTNAGTNKYSTDEIICGEWIDGKPIYRKAYNDFTLSTPYNQWKDLTPAPSNIDKVIKFDGVALRDGNPTPLNFHISSTLYGTIRINNNNYLSYYIANSNESERITIRFSIEYTKTTD